MANIYPWQTFVFEKLIQAHEQNRLPHGLLLTARSGSGADEFVTFWAQYVLCSNKQYQSSCGECKSCRLFDAETHPDYQWIEVLEDKKQISIVQIRELTQQMQETASLSGWRIAVVFEAEKMTVNGYNALLKTLEEPGQATQLILVASDRSSIPATIISRCQHFSIQPEDSSLAMNWLGAQVTQLDVKDVKLALELSHNSPLKALKLLSDEELPTFFELADLLEKILRGSAMPTVLSEQKTPEPLTLLEWWDFLVSQMLYNGVEARQSSHPGLKNYRVLAEMAHQQLLFELRDNILFQLKELREGVALNINMQLDALAQQWVECRK